MSQQTVRQKPGQVQSQTVSSRSGEKDPHRYDDIIDLPHHVSKTHPQMPLADRAAQFAPFAALTGHADAIRETERMVEERVAHEYEFAEEWEEWEYEER